MACNYHYLGWVLTWKYLKQGFWGEIYIYIRGLHSVQSGLLPVYYYTPTHREGAILQLPCPSVHTFVTDISASNGRNDFIFDIWLWHGDLYCVSPFQVYHTSTSCLLRDLEIFMFAVMKIFVTDISASTGRNDFIFDIWLWHGNLYRVSPFQIYFLFTVRLRIFHACRNKNFCNRYLSFYWKK